VTTKEQRGDLHEIEGWTTDAPQELKWYLANAGKWSVWKQLQVDARAWKTVGTWVVCLALFVVGALSHSPRRRVQLLVFGGFFALAYARALLRVVQGRKAARLVEGTVPRFDQVHPLFGWLRTGAFVPSGDGSPTATVILAEWAVKKFVYPGMTLQVLALVSPRQEMSTVVGVRSPVRLG